jgi:hypothetical protein
MYGGLTGFGMHHPSLGGLLIGGAKLNPANFATEDDYNRAYMNQKMNKKIYSGKRKIYARGELKHLIDAESWAARTALVEGHPEYADWLSRDYKKDIKLLEKKTLPTWAAVEYSYGKRFAPPREKMSEEHKARLAYNAMEKKLIRQRNGTPKILNPQTGKMVYVDTATGKKILKARGVLGEFSKIPIARQRASRGERLYSTIEEAEANRPLTGRERSLANLELNRGIGRSISAAARSGQNPLGISDAALIAALESGEY